MPQVFLFIYNTLCLLFVHHLLLGTEGAKNLRARFENMAQKSEDEARQQAQQEKLRRQATESREKTESEAREKV